MEQNDRDKWHDPGYWKDEYIPEKHTTAYWRTKYAPKQHTATYWRKKYAPKQHTAAYWRSKYAPKKKGIIGDILYFADRYARKIFYYIAWGLCLYKWYQYFTGR